MSRFDPFGLFGSGGIGGPPPWLPPPPPEGISECITRINDEVWKEHGETRGEDDQSARKAHCIAHCRITRECPGGAAASFLGGLAKEVIDEILQQWNNEGDGYDGGDMNANGIGRKCAPKKDKSCEELCDDEFDDGNLYPPPPDVGGIDPALMVN